MDYIKPFKYILEIAKYQSISLAAEKLNIRQPALSKYLKKVETELGTELFDRSTNPIRLTEAGKCYIEAAHRVIDADTQLQKQIHDIQGNAESVRIGISPSRAPYLLPAISKKLASNVSKTSLVILEGTTSELNSALIKGEIDLAISILDAGTKEFDHIELFDEKILLAVARDIPVNSFQEAFSALNIISFEKGQVMAELLSTMPEHKSTIECRNVTTAISLVKAGVGAALVPSYIADYGDTDGLRFFQLPDNMVRTRKVCIFYRREQFLSFADKAFIKCSVEAIGSTGEKPPITT